MPRKLPRMGPQSRCEACTEATPVSLSLRRVGYQLQNLSITESLNANGARKETLVFNSEHAMISVSNKNQTKRQILCLMCVHFPPEKDARRCSGSFNKTFVPTFVGAIRSKNTCARGTHCTFTCAVCFSRPLFPFRKFSLPLPSQDLGGNEKKNQSNCQKLLLLLVL
jgi:hypothetical protein